MKFLVISNCQGTPVKESLQSLQGFQAERFIANRTPIEQLTPAYLSKFDLVLAQDLKLAKGDDEMRARLAEHPLVVRFPWFVFFGFTPDFVSLNRPQSAPKQVTKLVSAPRIVLAARARGLNRNKARALYNPEFLDAMGYSADYTAQRALFLKNLSQYTPRATYFFEKWFEKGPFFYSSNHPKMFVIEDMLREILAPHGVKLPATQAHEFLRDPLARHDIFPHYNHPAASNRLDDQNHIYKTSVRLMPLEQKITQIYRELDQESAAAYASASDLERFDKAHAAWTGHTPEPMINPYKSRPSHNFWSRTVAKPAAKDVRPGAGIKPVIDKTTKVATAGSCFAQHVARAMVSDGLNYYVAEPAPATMAPEMAQERGYGLFSARYGNIYSTRQLVQLIRRAYGTFTPIETAWKTPDGFIDPFRPNIGETFDSVKALETARADHLAQVREMFESLDVFVFTLGLTEGWVDRRDHAAYPVTPGAVTKSADPVHFAFENLTYPQIKQDLYDFLGELWRVNPKARVIFTVSPVPLIATYGETDVLSATTYSKSVLRAAAGDIAEKFDAVQYFPSYEIITGSYNHGAYFEEDLRGIRPEGVAHVMGIFRDTLIVGADGAALPDPDPIDDETEAERQKSIADAIAKEMHVVCDEELLVRS